MSKNWQRRNLRFFIGIFLVLVTGCTIKIPVKVLPMFVENKIPYHVVLVIPEDIRQRECKHPGLTNFNKFNCGPALYETCKKTMDNFFVDVQTVKDIKEATKPWDRTLWLEVDEFRMVGMGCRCGDFGSETPDIKAVNRVCLALKYKLTDNNGKELLSSNISFEEKLSIFDETVFFSTTDPLRHERAAFSGVIEKAILKMVDELMDAYKKEQL